MIVQDCNEVMKRFLAKLYEKRIQEIHTEVRTTTKNVIRRYQREAKQEAKTLIAQTEQRAESESLSSLHATQLEMQKRIDAIKKEFVEAVFASLKKQIAALPARTKKSLMTSMQKNVKQTIKGLGLKEKSFTIESQDLAVVGTSKQLVVRDSIDNRLHRLEDTIVRLALEKANFLKTEERTRKALTQ